VFLWILAGVMICSGIQYWISDRVAPWGMRKHFEIEDVKIRKRPPRVSQVRQERIWYRNRDVLYNVRYFDPENNQLFDVTLYTFDDNFHVAQKIYAQRAVWQGNGWILKDGHVTVTDRRMSHPTSEAFETRKTQLIEDPKTLKRGDFSADLLNQGDLLQTIRRYKKLGINTARWEVVFHSRWSLLLVAFVFLALAFPVATKFSRIASRGASMAFAVGVSLAFWLVFNFSANAGAAGRIHPILAAWGPSVLALVGVGFYLRSKSLRIQSD
jgi:lipopolysaccharide export system permease protein